MGLRLKLSPTWETIWQLFVQETEKPVKTFTHMIQSPSYFSCLWASFIRMWNMSFEYLKHYIWHCVDNKYEELIFVRVGSCS